MLTINTTRL